MTTTRYKYPRTFHLPWSPGATKDDKVLSSVDHFYNMDEVVVTEKLDGENFTFYCDGCHARSVDSRHHESRSLMKQLHAAIAPGIPYNVRVCGENMTAVHTIRYDSLPSYFIAHSVWGGETCANWDNFVEWCGKLGLYLPPVLYRGKFDEEAIRACWTGRSQYGAEQEGYVVRNAGIFTLPAFDQNVAKFVRADHVKTDKHWMHRQMEKNGIL
jgi:hypothetical protein